MPPLSPNRSLIDIVNISLSVRVGSLAELDLAPEQRRVRIERHVGVGTLLALSTVAGGALALGCAASAEKRCRRDNEDHVVDV